MGKPKQRAGRVNRLKRGLPCGQCWEKDAEGLLSQICAHRSLRKGMKRGANTRAVPVPDPWRQGQGGVGR